MESTFVTSMKEINYAFRWASQLQTAIAYLLYHWSYTVMSMLKAMAASRQKKSTLGVKGLA